MGICRGSATANTNASAKIDREGPCLSSISYGGVTGRAISSARYTGAVISVFYDRGYYQSTGRAVEVTLESAKIYVKSRLVNPSNKKPANFSYIANHIITKPDDTDD